MLTGLSPAGLTASLAAPTPASALAPAARSHAGVLALRAIGLTVFDLDRTERFYRDTLDLRTVARQRLEDSFLNALFGLPAGPVNVLTMQIGDQQVEFTQFARPGRPYPADSQKHRSKVGRQGLSLSKR